MSRIRVGEISQLQPSAIAPVSTLPMFVPPPGIPPEPAQTCISAAWLPTVYPVQLIQICKEKQ